MNKTLACVSLDLKLMKPYFKGVLMIMGLGLIFAFSMKSTTILQSYFIMSLILIMSYPFAVGEKNKLEILYGTLSITKNNVVIGRYFFVLALEVCGAVIILLTSWVVSMIMKLEFILSEQILILCILASIFAIVVAIQYPFYFKLGYAKAKLISFIPLIIVFLLIIQLPSLSKMFNWNTAALEEKVSSIMSNGFLLYLVPILIALIALAISCYFSCKIYSKKEV